MPILHVRAEASAWNANSKNNHGIPIEVAVADQHGNPVTGLGESGFRVQLSWEYNPGGTSIANEIVVKEHDTMPGTYLLVVNLPGNPNWNRGTYFAHVAVVKGDARAQSTADSPTAKGRDVTKVYVPTGA